MMKRLMVLSALALPLLFVSASGYAQGSRSGSSQTSSAAIEARHKCFLEAQARVPADPNSPNTTASLRTPVYVSCARRMGVRP